MAYSLYTRGNWFFLNKIFITSYFLNFNKKVLKFFFAFIILYLIIIFIFILDLLESLINSAKESNVSFVYALSPGIDIVYSNPKEVKTLQEKFEQVRSLGCESFALLFDDIEPSMNEQDRKKFPSFAEAQVTVSNTVYENLDSPSFMFCPTGF